jgi:hypothetical protein
MKKLLLFSMALLISASIYAQRGNNPVYMNTWEYTVQDGMNDQFEAAVAKKTAMFNKTAETAIYTYTIVTGRNSGRYIRVSPNLTSEDYDNSDTKEVDYWIANVMKHVEKAHGQIRWQRLNNGSYNPSPERTSPYKYVQRTTFDVKADKTTHFRRFMSRLAKVAEKRGSTNTRSLYRLVSGGNRNQFVVANLFDTYKRGEGQKNENTFREDYNEMFGWGSIEEDSNNFDASLEAWGERVETLQLLPEMSTKL